MPTRDYCGFHPGLVLQKNPGSRSLQLRLKCGWKAKPCRETHGIEKTRVGVNGPWDWRWGYILDKPPDVNPLTCRQLPAVQLPLLVGRWQCQAQHPLCRLQWTPLLADLSFCESLRTEMCQRRPAHALVIKGQKPETVPRLTWRLDSGVFSRPSGSGISALPGGSTCLVAGFNGLKGQRHISSSKPVELDHDERDCHCKKKKKKSRESAKDEGILLVVLSCCAPPSVALGWVAVLVGGNITFPPALV